MSTTVPQGMSAADLNKPEKIYGVLITIGLEDTYPFETYNIDYCDKLRPAFAGVVCRNAACYVIKQSESHLCEWQDSTAEMKPKKERIILGKHWCSEMNKRIMFVYTSLLIDARVPGETLKELAWRMIKFTGGTLIDARETEAGMCFDVWERYGGIDWFVQENSPLRISVPRKCFLSYEKSCRMQAAKAARKQKRDEAEFWQSIDAINDVK